MENEKCVYHNGMITVTLLTDDQARPYREMANGLSQDATTIRSVAEKDGVKRIWEIRDCGYNVITVKV